MPSNKNKQREKMERTGKNEMIHPALSIVPALDKDGNVFYKIVKITFTLTGKCVSIETVAKATNEFQALVKFNNALVEDIGDIKQMRNVVKELKEDVAARKATKLLKEEKKNEAKTKV